MYRAQLKMKKILQNKWEKQLNVLHIERLVNIKSRVDTHNRSALNLSFKNSKKEQMLEGIYIHNLHR